MAQAVNIQWNYKWIDQSESRICRVCSVNGLCVFGSTGPVLMSLRPGGKDLQPCHITSHDGPLRCQDTRHLHDIILDTREWTEDDTQSLDWISSHTLTKSSRRETEPHESSVCSSSEVRGHHRRTLMWASHWLLLAEKSPNTSAGGQRHIHTCYSPENMWQHAFPRLISQNKPMDTHHTLTSSVND